MKFAKLTPVSLHNINDMVPDVDAPDFLEQLSKLRDFTYRRDYFPTEKELASQKFKNTSIFINQSKLFHGDKYSYEYTVYYNANTYVILYCKACKKYFYQTAKNHTQYGCKDCSIRDLAENKAIPDSEFICRAKKLHRHNNYDGIKFISCNNIVENILCTKCGKYFNTFGQSHIRSDKPIGCPYCRRSKAEILAENYLIDNGYDFKPQFSNVELKITKLLKIDFMIFKNGKMYAIELNGKQHYIQANRSKDMELNIKNFTLYKIRDAKKVEWCAERGIPLLVISYLDFHKIPELIEAFINKYI
jgi:DNA-directed RNA polymerase subunit RPC12/RpoP